MVTHVLEHMSNPDMARRMLGDEAADTLAAGGHFTHWAREAKAFARIEAQLRASLT